MTCILLRNPGYFFLIIVYELLSVLPGNKICICLILYSLTLTEIISFGILETKFTSTRENSNKKETWGAWKLLPILYYDRAF